MTTHHEAPGLDELPPDVEALIETLRGLGRAYPENIFGPVTAQFMVKAADMIESQAERLRAIENAKGMPEITPIGCGCAAMAQDGKTSPVVWFGNYPADGAAVYGQHTIDALRLSHQHLQDRLNRMESAGQMCVDALLHRGVSRDPEHPDRQAVDAMSAATKGAQPDIKPCPACTRTTPYGIRPEEDCQFHACPLLAKTKGGK